MEQVTGNNGQEHVVNISRGHVDSIPPFDGNDHHDLDELHYDEGPPTSVQDTTSQSSSTSPNASNSRSVSFTRRGDTYGRPRQRNPLNSGLWISIELVVNVSQIMAAVLILSLSRHEHPQSPLFAWVIGYTAGCLASLPHLYWRFIHRNHQSSEHASEHRRQVSSQVNLPESVSYDTYFSNALEGDGRTHTAAVVQSRHASLNVNTRISSLVDHYKMALDCFFAVWFVVGTVWTFGGHSSELSAPNLYRLCIVFLTFSCIGYAMPFVLCATICCCLPCIISVLGFREDMRPAKGATLKLINTLPTYKFISKRNNKSGDSDIISEQLSEGGILSCAKKERIVSAEDADCCICLAKYLDNDEVRELPCSHFFHMECVDKWLKINALCPLCKSGIQNTSTSLLSFLSRFRISSRSVSATDPTIS